MLIMTAIMEWRMRIMSPTRAAIPGRAASAGFRRLLRGAAAQGGGNLIIASLIWHRAGSLHSVAPSRGARALPASRFHLEDPNNNNGEDEEDEDEDEEEQQPRAGCDQRTGRGRKGGMAKPLPPPDRFAPHAIGGASSKGRLMLRVNSSRAPDDDPTLIEAVAVGAGGDVQQMLVCPICQEHRCPTHCDHHRRLHVGTMVF
jgi:hypothetical protein